MGSDIARFRAEQATHEQAAQMGLSGYAIVARHDSIEKRMEQGAIYIQHLIDAGQHEQVRTLLEMDDWLHIALQMKGETHETNVTRD
jgi:hypothetical protein